MTQTALRTPLYEAHVRAGGRMVPFAGYDMPVQYSSIIAESKAVRGAAGMFDVSHMARLTFTGERVLEFLEHITTNDVSKLADRTGQYSLLPNASGGCVDDIIVYRMNLNEFRLVVNAANHEKDVAWITMQNTFDVRIEDTTDRTAMIAVQGPKAVEILKPLAERPDELGAAPAFGISEQSIAGVAVFAARSGYTGEDGYELICAAGEAVKLWDALVQAGVAPCGLGSRDTLRVEAGLPLYGHELRDDLSPIAAGLGWVISKTKSFVGADMINQARSEGTPRKIQGILLDSKRLPAPEMAVYQGDRQVGEVTSGVFSPLMDAGIAFALVDANLPLGSTVEIDVRGKRESGTLVNKRFYKRPKDD